MISLKPRAMGRLALQAVLAVVVVIAFIGVAAAITHMPGTIVIKGLEDRFGPVSFDHEKHVMMAGACGKCHHLHNNEAVAACRTCHALKAEDFKATANQGFLRCEGCHSDASVESPGMPSLKVAFHKACFSCHAGMGGVGETPKGCQTTCHSLR